MNVLMDYDNDFPHDGQNRSVTITGFPHFGQKPADLTLRPLRCIAIIDSRSSSVTSGLAVAPSARRAAIAFSRRASVSWASLSAALPLGKGGVIESILRKISAPFCKRKAR